MINTNIQRLVGILAAFALMAFALPGIAGPDKTYRINVAVPESYNGNDNPTYDATSGRLTSAVVFLTIKNEGPPFSDTNANSNISSFSVVLPGLTLQPGSWSAPSGTVSWNAGTHTLSVRNISPVKGTDTYTLVLYPATCGDITVASSAAYTGSQLNGNMFDLLANAIDPNADPDQTFLNNFLAPISCVQDLVGDCSGNVNPTFEVAAPSLLSTDPGYVLVTLDRFTKSGACAIVSDVWVSNLILDSLNANRGRLHVRWPTDNSGGQPGAAFMYTVNLPGATRPTPKVGWLGWDDNTNTPIALGEDLTVEPYVIDAPQCLTDQLPTPYGKLVSTIFAGATQIQVDTSSGVLGVPKKGEFPIVIGTERLQVTKTTGSGTWSLKAPVTATHNALDWVVSTPLPIMTSTAGPYQVNTPAQMCVTALPTKKNSGGTWSFTFVDIYDGFGGSR